MTKEPLGVCDCHAVEADWDMEHRGRHELQADCTNWRPVEASAPRPCGHNNPLLNSGCPHCSAEIPLDSQEIAASAPAAPPASVNLHDTFDGLVWAKEFCRIAGGKGIVIDEDWMHGWFANAIMAGYDHARRESAPSPTAIEEVVRVILKQAATHFPHTDMQHRLVCDCGLEVGSAGKWYQHICALKPDFTAILPILRGGK